MKLGRILRFSLIYIETISKKNTLIRFQRLFSFRIYVSAELSGSSSNCIIHNTLIRLGRSDLMATTSSLKIAVICSSNMNRSMEAHAFLSKKGFFVKSFGTGDKVKIPGSAADKPNVYDFGVSYDEIYHDLLAKDKTLYPCCVS